MAATASAVRRGQWPALLLLSALAACTRPGAEEGDFPRSQTFYLGGKQWGEPASFNPLLTSPDFPVSMNLVYECLLLFDSPSGKLQPMLAQSWEVDQGHVRVTLDPRARWNDGQPVTADDVVYTFQLGRRYKSIPQGVAWQYLEEVRAIDDPQQAATSTPAGTRWKRTVEFVLDQQHLNPLVILDQLTTIRVIARHNIEPALASVGGDLEAFNKLKFDKGVVSSGPYRILSSSSEKIVLERDDAYWGNGALHGGKKPAPKFFIHPIYKSNDHFSVALQQGRLDASNTFVPRIWLKEKKGVHAWFDKPPFFPAAGIPMLYINHTRSALGDVHLRRAMGFAINYGDIRELAMSGYSDELRPGLVLPFGREARFFDEGDARRYGTSFSPEKAREELKAGGYTAQYNGKGDLTAMFDKAGQRVPTLFIKSPTGWSDYEAVVRIVVRSLRAVGIDARERFVDASLFWPAWFSGDFDLLMNMPVPVPAPSKPWSRFEALLASREWRPEGEKMYKNQGRFNQPGSPNYLPRIEELLEEIPRLTDEAAQIAAYKELNRIVMQEQPVLPLVYRPDQFYEYSDKVWTGFASARNPYLPPQVPGDGPGVNALWSLTPAGGR
jgi:peptide/nickel transport system substrate-binding protein